MSTRSHRSTRTHPTSSGRRRRRARPWAAAVLAATALLAGACSNSSGTSTASGGDGTTPVAADAAVEANGSPGVTDDEIRFVSFGTRANNPLGTCVADCFDQGVKAYFAWRNSEGGVHGRQLVLADQLDDEVAKNQERALEIVSDDDAFGAFSAALVASGYETIADAGIPLYTWAINFDEMSGHAGIYGDRPVLCVNCLDRFMPFAGTVAGASRVGTLGYGVAQVSKDCVTTVEHSLAEYGDEAGQTLAYSNPDLPFGLANGVAPEVTAMKDAGVDFIVACFDLNGVKTVEQELERQGMGDVPVLQANAYDADFIREGGDLFDGDLIMVSFRPFEADAGQSQLDTFKDWMDRTGSPLSEIAMQGWINADLAYQGLVAAGPSFTRAGVIDATNRLTDWTAGGLVPPIDWSRQHEPWTDEDPTTHGYVKNCRSLVRVVDGRFELVGEKDKPFFCYDTSSSAWTDPTPTDVE